MASSVPRTVLSIHTLFILRYTRYVHMLWNILCTYVRYISLGTWEHVSRHWNGRFLVVSLRTITYQYFLRSMSLACPGHVAINVPGSAVCTRPYVKSSLPDSYPKYCVPRQAVMKAVINNNSNLNNRDSYDERKLQVFQSNWHSSSFVFLPLPNNLRYPTRT